MLQESGCLLLSPRLRDMEPATGRPPEQTLAVRRQSHAGPDKRVKQHMQLIVNIDQRAAITRGFNCDSTCKLDVDVSTLTQTQRTQLGTYFNHGRLYESFGFLPEPTLAALTERLDALHAEAEAKTAEAEAKAKSEAEAMQKWLATPDAELVEYKTSCALQGYYSSVVLDANGDLCPYAVNASGKPVGLAWVPNDTRIAVKPSPGTHEKHQRLLDLARSHNLPIYHAALADKGEHDARAAAASAKLEADIAAVIHGLGSDAQKARLARGLMADPKAEARTLAADDMFRTVPLDVATPPDDDDIDIPENFGGDLDGCDVVRDSEPAKKLTDEQMVDFIGAEAAIRGTLPAASVSPWLLQITRRHDAIPWHSKLVARATVPHCLGELVRDFDLP